jgi:hypothetical protein
LRLLVIQLSPVIKYLLNNKKCLELFSMIASHLLKLDKKFI